MSRGLFKSEADESIRRVIKNMIFKNVLKAILIVAIFLITITINPAIVGHAEKTKANGNQITREYMNASSHFDIMKIIKILINIISYVICFVLGYCAGQLLYDLLHNPTNYH